MMNNKEVIKGLLESLPYTKEFSNKIIVIKYGGSIMDNKIAKDAFIEDLALIKKLGMQPIIVHGGGKEISKRLNRLNIQSEFLDGYRITTEEAIDEIEMTLSGKVNNLLLTSLSKVDINAVGLSGKDMQFIQVSKKQSNHIDKDYGYVGVINNIKTDILKLLIKNDIIPVISPIGVDENFKTYNINADDVASEICTALNAEKLILLTDVNGLYKDFNDKDSFISLSTTNNLSNLIKDDYLSGAILPKVYSCINAINNGVTSCHILNGSIEHSVLLELFTDEGIGTKIYKEGL